LGGRIFLDWGIGFRESPAAATHGKIID